MQVNLKVTAEVYKVPDQINGLGPYKVKVYVYPLGLYFSLRFMLFNPQMAQYELYPNSTMDQYQKRWVDNFEFSKNTDFFELILEEVISAVEEETKTKITRRGAEVYESL